MHKEKAIDRIKKLLELSKSSNENEAASAAARAAEMMLDNQIAEAELCDGAAEVEAVTDEVLGTDGKVVAWKMNLVSGLAKSLGCKFYYMSSYKSWSGSRHKAKYHAVGPKSALDTVTYMYTYLCTEVNRLANTAYADEHTECQLSGVNPPSARGWKSSFRVGCSATIENRLLVQRKTTMDQAKTDGKTQALMVVNRQQEAVSMYVEQNLPRLRSGQTSSAGSSSRSGYSAGSEAGRSVSLGGSSGALSAGRKQLGS